MAAKRKVADAVAREPSPSHDLHVQIEAARVLLANFRDILGDDEQAKADTVEGQTDLHGAIRKGVRRIAELGAMREGLKAAMKNLSARDARFEQQEQHLRVALRTAMEQGSLSYLETELATISRVPVAPSLVVTKEDEIPAQWWVRGDPRLDRRALTKALKELPPGESIPGATLSNGGETIKINPR